MDEELIGLSPKALSNDGPITRLFRKAGVDDFAGAARYLLNLPYGRITERSRLWLVLTEGRGTCTTKHTLLAELAREQSIDVKLILGIYEMNERNTPGVGHVLEPAASSVPEPASFVLLGSGLLTLVGIRRRHTA